MAGDLEGAGGEIKELDKILHKILGGGPYADAILKKDGFNLLLQSPPIVGLPLQLWSFESSSLEGLID